MLHNKYTERHRGLLLFKSGFKSVQHPSTHTAPLQILQLVHVLASPQQGSQAAAVCSATTGTPQGQHFGSRLLARLRMVKAFKPHHVNLGVAQSQQPS